MVSFQENRREIESRMFAVKKNKGEQDRYWNILAWGKNNSNLFLNRTSEQNTDDTECNAKWEFSSGISVLVAPWSYKNNWY